MFFDCLRDIAALPGLSRLKTAAFAVTVYTKPKKTVWRKFLNGSPQMFAISAADFPKRESIKNISASDGAFNLISLDNLLSDQPTNNDKAGRHWKGEQKMLSNPENKRVLGRMGARVLTPEEIKQVSGGSTWIFNTPIMTFIGTNDPDVKTDFLHD
jgi:hypothetical protein